MNRDTAISAVQTLHEFLRESRPKWTNETPTAEGFYWLRQFARDAMVVEVRVDYSEAETPFVVQIGDPATTGVQYLRDFRDCKWAGPIEKPQG